MQSIGGQGPGGLTVSSNKSFVILILVSEALSSVDYALC